MNQLKSVNFSATFLAIVIIAAVNINKIEARMTMAQIQNAMKPAGKTCAGKTGVSKEILAQTREGVFPEDRDLMCYHACLLKMMKMMTKDNKIAIDTMMKQIDLMMPEDLIQRTKDVSQKCFDDLTTDEACEMSWQFVKCYSDTDRSLYFFP
uniref:Odorant binding protein 2 n=1 Tax=Macrocentrus cingulum TaxID=535359 RepID=A0A221I2J6_9HYME|nr:odorant binding protein 2 [Macrocentrus cingulum]